MTKIEVNKRAVRQILQFQPSPFFLFFPWPFTEKQLHFFPLLYIFFFFFLWPFYCFFLTCNNVFSGLFSFSRVSSLRLNCSNTYLSIYKKSRTKKDTLILVLTFLFRPYSNIFTHISHFFLALFFFFFFFNFKQRIIVRFYYKPLDVIYIYSYWFLCKDCFPFLKLYI